MADKLVISIPGAIRWEGARTVEATAALLEGYRDLLAARSASWFGRWSAPTHSKTGFISFLQPGATTVSEASIRALWAQDEVQFRLSITLNPTRTLAHILPRLVDGGGIDQLAELTPDIFWAASEDAASADTLDGNDNALAALDRVHSLFGPAYPRRFMEIFEDNLRWWAIEAVAPYDLWFDADLSGNPTARRDDKVVTLSWSNLVVGYAELFCERRHSTARELMDRVSTHVLASHENSDWQRYADEYDAGGRQGQSMRVGISPTKDIRQVFYAKRRDRIRMEVRYLQHVRKSLRMTAQREALPLRSVFSALQRDAASRIAWKTFCRMSIEPPKAMLTELSDMMARIAECARGANVAAKPVFTALLSTGSIAEGDREQFPRRLMRRLEAAGLIDRQSLVRRVRPGEVRRHRLAAKYAAMVSELQKAFYD